MINTLAAILILFSINVASAKVCWNANPNDCAGKAEYAGCEVTATGDEGICKAYGRPDRDFYEYACQCRKAPERRVMCDYGASDTACTGKPGYSECSAYGAPGRCVPLQGPSDFGDYRCGCERS